MLAGFKPEGSVYFALLKNERARMQYAPRFHTIWAVKEVTVMCIRARHISVALWHGSRGHSALPATRVVSISRLARV
jgi:hypothetical protein